jgi:hypothetical protein
MFSEQNYGGTSSVIRPVFYEPCHEMDGTTRSIIVARGMWCTFYV